MLFIVSRPDVEVEDVADLPVPQIQKQIVVPGAQLSKKL